MSTTLSPSFELPSGYTATERIGAGGYGEVWKGMAPGGMEKAIKVVFGRCDEDLAERELKSLERIKSVRHPFVLSIERYEIVGGRLVIVTELADMSLNDCYQRCRSEGGPGIPRAQLLGYLWDAAEALDCLVEQHQLQHLDIKPENLLIVGDHVKVADFGLVKELTSRTLNSVMGGMTPIFSAPEIFDDAPSRHSDQYSLAIVYQQMLTGTLPFPGRTPAQLAKQHTLSEPNLQSFNDTDRVVMRRALEKNPDARFSSCRKFVAALRSGRVLPGAGASVGDKKLSGILPAETADKDDTKSVASLNTEPVPHPAGEEATPARPEISDPAQVVRPAPVKEVASSSPPLPPVTSEIEDIQWPTLEAVAASEAVPTMFIGVGGIGVSLLTRVRQRISSCEEEDQPSRPQLAWLAIDTDRDALAAATREEPPAISLDDVLHTALRRPKQYRDASKDLLRWVSRRWLYNIPRSLQTRGYRPLGRIAIVDHAAEVLHCLETRIQRLADREPSRPSQRPKVRVVILAGMSGGTGGGILLDIAQAVRSVCRQVEVEVNVQGVLGCTFHCGSSDSLAAANMYSLLTELNHAQQCGNVGDCAPSGRAAWYESPTPPFDNFYTVAIPPRNHTAERQLALRSIADYLALQATTIAGSLFEKVHSLQPDASRSVGWHTAICIALRQTTDSLMHAWESQFRQAVVRHWLTPISGVDDPHAHLFDGHASSRFAHAVLSRIPAVLPANHKSADQNELGKLTKRRAREVKRLAAAFSQWLQQFTAPASSDKSALHDAQAEAAADRVVTELVSILGTGSGSESELCQRLECLLQEQSMKVAKSQAVTDPSRLASLALSLTDKRPLHCGYRRHTLLLIPPESGVGDTAAAISAQRPTVASFQVPVAEPYLVCEGHGFSAQHLAARLSENYPDIDAAACRLHSRDDICWRDLTSE